MGERKERSYIYFYILAFSLCRFIFDMGMLMLSIPFFFFFKILLGGEGILRGVGEV